MHLRAKPPKIVPFEFKDEIEELSKAFLMDLVWDLATKAKGDVPVDDVMNFIRDRRRVVEITRDPKAPSRYPLAPSLRR